MLAVLLHSAGVANFAFTIWYEFNVISIPEEISPRRSAYGGVWKYLTFWNLWIQMIYFGVALANDLGGSKATDSRKSSGLQKLRDHMFSTLGFPIGIFVGVAFWGLYAIDR